MDLEMLDHCALDERGYLFGGKVIPKYKDSLSHLRHVQHQDALPERRIDLVDDEESQSGHRDGEEERGELFRVTARLDIGDGGLVPLLVAERDIGDGSFLSQMACIAFRADDCDGEVGHVVYYGSIEFLLFHALCDTKWLYQQSIKTSKRRLNPSQKT